MPFAAPTLVSVALATLGCIGFVAALFALSLLLPGSGAVRDRAARRRPDGLAILGVTLAGSAAMTLVGPGLAPLARQFWSLLIAANLFAWPAALALFLAAGDGRPRRLADFFLGSAQSRSLFGIDLKMFSYRPSLLGLMVMNLSFASLQAQEEGRLTLAMALYQAFTLLYVGNYFQFERGMRFTWDVIEERFGWSLVWGDYVLVPFFYCLPALYVFLRPEALPLAAAAALAALYGCGFWLFRGANGQKHRFKERPDAPIWGRPASTVGGRLLVSGFWGIGRKLNYTGELLIYSSWTLLCGFQSWIPYLVPVWLLGLLVHRAGRDDRRCRMKYGALWDEYCRRARFRMFPYLY